MKNGVKGMLEENEEQEKDIDYAYMKLFNLWSAHIAGASCSEVQGKKRQFHTLLLVKCWMRLQKVSRSSGDIQCLWQIVYLTSEGL